MMAIAVIAVVFIPRSGVREIRNSNQLSNFVMVDPRPRPGDWPAWRGTDSRNVAVSTQIPLQWQTSDDDGWQVSVPGRGHATPIVWGEQVFLMTADHASQRISLFSYDRVSGRTIWHRELHQGGLPTLPDKQTHASSTPACDGQFIYTTAAVHDALWITSVDLTGRIVWQRAAGPFSSKSGHRSSPILHKSLVIVAADQHRQGYLSALHRQTGEIVWRVKRPHGESHGSPVIATLGGRTQLVLGGKGAVTSYDPTTGDELWTFKWSADRVANSIAFDDEHVFATSNYPSGEVVCIKADGTGDVTKSKLVWRHANLGSDTPSPVQRAGLLYVLSDDGRLACFEAVSGKVLWRKQLTGTFTSSPVLAGEHLVCSNESGVHTILQTGTTTSIVAENSLPDGIVGSPIVVDNSIFIRTLGKLRCIVSPSSESVADKPETVKRRL